MSVFDSTHGLHWRANQLGFVLQPQNFNQAEDFMSVKRGKVNKQAAKK